MATAPLEPRTEEAAVPQALVETVVAPALAEQALAEQAFAPPSQRDAVAQFEFLAAQEVEESPGSGSPRRWIVTLAVAGVILLAIVALTTAASVGLLNALTGEEHSRYLTAPIARGSLVVTVTAKGTLESANSKNIKCDVEKEGGSQIRWIIENGEKVKKGDKLVEFDQSSLKEQIKTQQIAMKTQGAVRDQAINDYYTAAEAVKEYEEGLFKQEHLTLSSAVVVAEQNLTSAQNALEHSERMFRKGYISDLQLESQRFAVTNAEIELNKAKTAVNTLANFTKKKMLIDLKGKMKTAETKMESEKEKYDLEESKLNRLNDQLAYCTIYAPQDGMVEYAIERSGRWGGQQTTIEAGAVIRLGVDILRMPDLTKMQAKVMVNETRIDRVKPGMPAVIKLAQGLQYEGEVDYVANQADQRSFFQASVSDFPVIVKITEALYGEHKPGMTVDVVITVDDKHKNVLRVPVTAVVHSGNESLCWVKTNTGAERRSLKLRLNGDKYNPTLVTDDAFFVVEEDGGLSEGEQVVLNPRSVIPEARKAEEVAKEAREKAAKEKKEKEAAEKAGPKAGPAKAGGAPGKDGARKGGGRGFDWSQLDKDGDGKVSREEAPESMRQFFDRMDANKDGFIDAKERAEAMERAKQRAGGAGARPKT